MVPTDRRRRRAPARLFGEDRESRTNVRSGMGASRPMVNDVSLELVLLQKTQIELATS